MTQEAAAPTLREASGSGLDDEPMMFTSPYYNDAQKLEFARGAIRFRNDVIANLRTRLAALAARPADPVEPSGSNPSLLASPEPSAETLREMWEAYSTVTEKAHEAMRLLYRIAVRRAAIATPAEPSSRERWNAENPGELSLHTFDDDATPAEPTDAQIAAYLKANNTYWHETDQELPNKPGQWRNGNVKEATRVSLRAALATPAEPSLPPLPERVEMGLVCDSTMRYTTVYGFTAEQMEAYARAALASPTEKAPQEETK